MGLYDKIDIHVSPSGDLSLDSRGDFRLAEASGVLQQDISFRLRTNYNEFVPHPDIGADLDALIGEQNTREIAKDGEFKIIHSLTHDGMVRNMDLYVRAVPLALEKIVYYVFVNNGTVYLNVTPDVLFDMMNGTINMPGV